MIIAQNIQEPKSETVHFYSFLTFGGSLIRIISGYFRKNTGTPGHYCPNPLAKSLGKPLNPRVLRSNLPSELQFKFWQWSSMPLRVWKTGVPMLHWPLRRYRTAVSNGSDASRYRFWLVKPRWVRYDTLQIKHGNNMQRSIPLEVFVCFPLKWPVPRDSRGFQGISEPVTPVFVARWSGLEWCSIQLSKMEWCNASWTLWMGSIPGWVQQ